VKNNLMENMGQFELQSSGVNISMSKDITVDHNTMDGSRGPASTSRRHLGGHVVENNDFFNCVQHTGDNGSITSGAGLDSGELGQQHLAPGTQFEGATGTS